MRHLESLEEIVEQLTERTARKDGRGAKRNNRVPKNRLGSNISSRRRKQRPITLPTSVPNGERASG